MVDSSFQSHWPKFPPSKLPCFAFPAESRGRRRARRIGASPYHISPRSLVFALPISFLPLCIFLLRLIAPSVTTQWSRRLSRTCRRAEEPCALSRTCPRAHWVVLPKFSLVCCYFLLLASNYELSRFSQWMNGMSTAVSLSLMPCLSPFSVLIGQLLTPRRTTVRFVAHQKKN